MKEICSPRTRGWSLDDRLTDVQAVLLPAHAGMVPLSPAETLQGATAPRARGDGPASAALTSLCQYCSPRTRGWSREALRLVLDGLLLPAHAGMVPRLGLSVESPTAAPRARGDGPAAEISELQSIICSPRTRGWSPEERFADGRQALLPAHAGMVPASSWCRPVAPAAPRARGDGPPSGLSRLDTLACSPRTRGWSHLGGPEPCPPGLLPAHAGMVPPRPPHSGPGRSAPRARGDGPREPRRRAGPPRCSPRTRGWSRVGPRPRMVFHLLPAHAGMVPS